MDNTDSLSIDENNKEPGDDKPPGEIGSSKPISEKPGLFSRLLASIGIKIRGNTSLEESVVELIEEHHDTEGKQVSHEERELLHNLLGFSELKVADVMIPRTDIIAVEYNITLDELKQLIIDKEHTRMPIYKEQLDDVVGFIHIKDLISYLGTDRPFAIDSFIRQILFVPPSMRAINLLAKMRASRVHMALVLDEYGGTDGLVTIEDLVEEIVGEIEDEHDEAEQPVYTMVDEHVIEASARMEIEDLEEKLGLTLVPEDNDEDFDTLGGLIFSLFGSVPKTGEKITHETGIEFEVLEADARRIHRVKIYLHKPSETAS